MARKTKNPPSETDVLLTMISSLDKRVGSVFRLLHLLIGHFQLILPILPCG